MSQFHAIAAMSQNRVIGRGNQIPWHLPEDFKWFKQMTTGQIVVMGRKTFESIGRPLPNRTTIILSRSNFQIAGVQTVDALEKLPSDPERKIFICGGAQIYEQTLSSCSDLYLTVVKRVIPDGDAFFPPFEYLFELAETIRDTDDFKILHYRRVT
jgi:dihydrofolate reductase